MKIEFEDSSYLEIRLSDSPGKVSIVLAAKDFKDPLKTNINATEITLQQFASLVNALNIELPK